MSIIILLDVGVSHLVAVEEVELVVVFVAEVGVLQR